MKAQNSLVCTVKNEADNLAVLLDSMLAQTRCPDEIVINDCGSSDGSDAIVERYVAAGHPVRLVRGGFNIPSGRNNAIRHARGSIIACTDAGLTLDRHWFERIIAPLEQERADVVGGFFRPAPQSAFELALGATNYRQASEIDPASFLPFGQSVAFRKQAWQRVGGYPEWASHCEDLLFDMALKRAGYRFAFVPDALLHFRPRESLSAFARQYFFYARGDGVAKLWTKRHIIRYATYLGGGLLALLARKRPWLFVLHAVGALAYCRAPLRRLRSAEWGVGSKGVGSREWGVGSEGVGSEGVGEKVISQYRTTHAVGVGSREWGVGEKVISNKSVLPHNTSSLVTPALYIPLIRVVGDLAKMLGYPVGIMRRLRSAELRERVREYWTKD